MKNIIENPYVNSFLRIVLIISISLIIYKISKKALKRILNFKVGRFDIDDRKEKTISNLLQKIIKYLLIILNILIILEILGVKTTGIITTLGASAVVFGLALQDLIKDFIAGGFFILDNTFNVGDIIEVNGFKGEVIDFGLKSIRVQNWKGEIRIIPNHVVNEVTNYSLNNSLAIVDIGIAYEEDLNRVEKILEKISKKLTKEIKEITGEIQILGVNKLDDSSVVYRLIVETKTMEHFGVERKIKKEIKNEFDKEKIKIPYPQIEVHNG